MYLKHSGQQTLDVYLTIGNIFIFKQLSINYKYLSQPSDVIYVSTILPTRLYFRIPCRRLYLVVIVNRSGARDVLVNFSCSLTEYINFCCCILLRSKYAFLNFSIVRDICIVGFIVKYSYRNKSKS